MRFYTHFPVVAVSLAAVLFTGLSGWNTARAAGSHADNGMQHGAHDHGHGSEKPPGLKVNDTKGDDSLPLDITISEDLTLVDQTATPRHVRTLLDGKLSLVFFGYSTCDGICPTALPTMASASELLRARGIDAQPIMITIDPERDTPHAMGERLADIGPDFIGLTGSEPVLADARRMFHVQKEAVHENGNGPVFKHGSFIYIVSPEGEVVSLLPPVLPPAQIATIAEKYL